MVEVYCLTCTLYIHVYVHVYVHVYMYNMSAILAYVFKTNVGQNSVQSKIKIYKAEWSKFNLNPSKISTFSI